MTRLCMLVLLAGLSWSQVAAEVYRCVDADGTTQFTDRPCDDDGRLYSFPAGRDAPAANDEHMDKTLRLLNALRQERIERQEREQREQNERVQRLRKCNIARDRLTQLQRAGRLYRLNDAGERVELSDEQHAAAIRAAEQDAARYCDSE